MILPERIKASLDKSGAPDDGFFGHFRRNFTGFGRGGIFNDKSEQSPTPKLIQASWFPDSIPEGLPQNLEIYSLFLKIRGAIETDNAWEIFGLTKDTATKPKLTRAYRQVIAKAHPDRCYHIDRGEGPCSKFANAISNGIRKVYENLNNQPER